MCPLSTSDTDLSKYPIIQEHLLKYKEIILGHDPTVEN